MAQNERCDFLRAGKGAALHLAEDGVGVGWDQHVQVIHTVEKLIKMGKRHKTSEVWMDSLEHVEESVAVTQFSTRRSAASSS